MKYPKAQRRTLDQLREHYEIEKELAQILRSASKDERKRLYTVVYDQLYRRVPYHPQITVKGDLGDQTEHVLSQMRLLKRFLLPEVTFLEIGPGDCSLAFEVAKFVKKVYAVDISKEITENQSRPKNVQLIISDGCDIPVPLDSVNLAYSNQLIEHLHPDDAFEHLTNVHNALSAGSAYICVTPNRLNGPHDISKYFDEVATGFHLKEYTITELEQMFKKAGFLRVLKLVWVKRRFLLLPIIPFKLIERVLSSLPGSLCQRIAQCAPVHLLLSVKLLGIK